MFDLKMLCGKIRVFKLKKKNSEVSISHNNYFSQKLLKKIFDIKKTTKFYVHIGVFLTFTTFLACKCF